MRLRRPALVLPVLLALSLLVAALPSRSQETKKAPPTPEKLAPYVPSPEEVVEKMLRLAEVKPSDTVYDLGSGDGRIVIMAAQKFGANAVGVELDRELFEKSSERIRDLKLQDKAKIVNGDLLKVDLSPATVVTLYLLTSANEKLKPRLEKELRKGARVVCHDFQVPGWTADKTESVSEEEVRPHTIYLYRR